MSTSPRMGAQKRKRRAFKLVVEMRYKEKEKQCELPVTTMFVHVVVGPWYDKGRARGEGEIIN